MLGGGGVGGECEVFTLKCGVCRARVGEGNPIHRQGLNQQRAEGPIAPVHRSFTSK